MFRKILLCFFAFTLLLVAGRGQDLPDVAQGLQPHMGSHGGMVDQVNVLNGGLTVRIPIVSFPQKGALSLSYSVIYNSFGFQDTLTCNVEIGRGQCSSKVELTPTAGLSISRVPGPRFVADQQLTVGGYSVQVVPADPSSNVNGRYYVIDADRSQHALGHAFDGFRSVDSAGYLFVPTDSTRYPAFLGDGPIGSDNASRMGVAEGIITESNGVIHSGNNIADLDGNMITFSLARSIAATDSVGRTIPDPVYLSNTSQCPTVPGTSFQPATSASSWTVPSAAPGGSSTYIFCYATIRIKTNFDPIATTA